MKPYLEKNFDLKLWKKIQDNFSLALELPLYTIDMSGKEIISSEANMPYWELINSNQSSKNLIALFRANRFKELIENNGNFLFYPCPSGLFNIMAPIFFKGNIVAAVILSGILYNMRNYNACKELSKITNIEYDKYAEALSSLNIKTKSEIEIYKRLIMLFLDTVPELAAQNCFVERKLSELIILNQISKMVNSTLELPEILTSVMNFMLKAIKAKSCSICIFEGKRRYGLHEPSKDLLKLESTIALEISEQKTSIKIPIINKDFRFYDLKIEYNALLSFPLNSKEELIGTLNLYGSYINLDDYDLEFLNIIITDIAIAIDNAKKYENIKESAIRDKLTGLFNRRYFMDLLLKEIEKSKLSQSPLSIALFDIDFFKKYNDQHGHLKGDKLLKELAELVKASVRSIDTVGRYGGEEFIIIMPETKSVDAKLVIERLHKNVLEKKFYGEELQPLKKVTISIGLVTCMNGSLTAEELIMQADKNLYNVKETGRNSIKGTIVIDRYMQAVEMI